MPWALISDGGGLVADGFPGLAPEAALRPVSADSQSVFLIESFREPFQSLVQRSRLRRILLGTGRDDPSFQVEHGSQDAADAIAAADGGVWLLERPAGFNGLFFDGVPHRLRRLTARGADSRFDPQEFMASSAALLASGDGSIALQTGTISPFWPGSGWREELQAFSPDGVAQGTFSVTGSAPFVP